MYSNHVNFPSFWGPINKLHPGIGGYDPDRGAKVAGCVTKMMMNWNVFMNRYLELDEKFIVNHYSNYIYTVIYVIHIIYIYNDSTLCVIFWKLRDSVIHTRSKVLLSVAFPGGNLNLQMVPLSCHWCGIHCSRIGRLSFVFLFCHIIGHLFKNSKVTL